MWGEFPSKRPANFVTTQRTTDLKYQLLLIEDLDISANKLGVVGSSSRTMMQPTLHRNGLMTETSVQSPDLNLNENLSHELKRRRVHESTQDPEERGESLY